MAKAYRFLIVLGLASCTAYGSAQKAAPGSYSYSGGGGGYYGPQPAATDPSPIATGGYQPAPQERPGLGTTWGETVNAPISFSPFVRASAAPWAQVVLHYNDSQGVAAHAAYVGAQAQPLEVYAGEGELSVALVDEAGRTLPGYYANGR